MNVPYHLVIEPRGHEGSANVVDQARIFTLPFPDLGQGSIPARNWVWKHAIKTGARRHWILDDNVARILSIKPQQQHSGRNRGNFSGRGKFC